MELISCWMSLICILGEKIPQSQRHFEECEVFDNLTFRRHHNSERTLAFGAFSTFNNGWHHAE